MFAFASPIFGALWMPLERARRHECGVPNSFAGLRKRANFDGRNMSEVGGDAKQKKTNQRKESLKIWETLDTDIIAGHRIMSRKRPVTTSVQTALRFLNSVTSTHESYSVHATGGRAVAN